MRNPYKALSKLDVQPENGFRRIENGVFRALEWHDLSARAFRVVFCLIDRTWGHQKLHEMIGATAIAKDTGLSVRVVRRAVAELKRRQIIVVKGERCFGSEVVVNRYMVNKYFDTWSESDGKLTPAPTLDTDDAKQQTGDKKDTGDRLGTDANSGHVPVQNPSHLIEERRKRKYPGLKMVIDHFCDRYAEKFTKSHKEPVRYSFGPGKDSSLIGEMLVCKCGGDVAKMNQAIDHFFTLTDPWVRSKGFNVVALNSQIDGILRELEGEQTVVSNLQQALQPAKPPNGSGYRAVDQRD